MNKLKNISNLSKITQKKQYGGKKKMRGGVLNNNIKINEIAEEIYNTLESNLQEQLNEGLSEIIDEIIPQLGHIIKKHEQELFKKIDDVNKNNNIQILAYVNKLINENNTVLYNNIQNDIDTKLNNLNVDLQEVSSYYEASLKDQSKKLSEFVDYVEKTFNDIYQKL